MDLYWSHSPRHKKLIITRWQPTAKGRKTRCILFYPPPSTTYFISWPFCDRAIHSLPCCTLSLWHTLCTCPLSSSHTSTHTNQPKHVILLAGNLYRFQSEKATTPQSGCRAPLLMCTGCPLWLHSSEAPHTNWAQSTLKAVTHTGNYNRAVLSYVLARQKKASLSGFPVY